MAEVTFHPAAAAEYEEALCWYAERSVSAADAFDEAVSASPQVLTCLTTNDTLVRTVREFVFETSD